MKKNKVVFPLIIILLLCFLPCSIYGIYSKVLYEKELGNPEHLHKFDNKLFYYDDNDKLIGYYECKTDICDDALPVVDDQYLNYYNGSEKEIGIFGEEYTFIQDGDVIKLHNIKTGISIAEFSSIKNYGTYLENGGIIVKDTQGNYGLFNMNTISFNITAKYMFMGIADNYNGSALPVDRIAVNDHGNWYVIDLDDQKLSKASIYPIYDYDKSYVYYYVDANKSYTIFDYAGTQKLANLVIKKFANSDNYNVIQTEQNQILIYDSNYQDIMANFTDYEVGLDFKIENNRVNIYDGDEVIDIFDLEKGELLNKR